MVLEEDNVQPQGTGNRAHGYMNADEAEYDDGQDQVLTGFEAEELESEDLEHANEDHGPLVPPTVEAHGPQRSNEDESLTIAVHDVKDFEPSMDDYQAVYKADAVEEVEGNTDDDNHPSIEQVSDSNVYTQMDSQYGSRSGQYNLRPRKPCRSGHMHHLLHEKLSDLNSQRNEGGVWQPFDSYPIPHK